MQYAVDSKVRTTVIGIFGALGKTKAHSLNLPLRLKFSAIGILRGH